MSDMRWPTTLARALCTALLAASAFADLPVPPQVLDPQTPAEAWNVIRLSTANVRRLLKEQRLDEVAPQISLCSPALRTLARTVPTPEHSQRVDGQTALAFRLVNDVAQAGMTRLGQSVEVAFKRLEAALAELKPAFQPSDIEAEIYSCPNDLEMIATSPGEKCRFCGGKLRVRRIPYTELFARPDAPRLALAVEGPESEAVVVPGEPVSFKVRLRQHSGQPVEPSELLSLHGAPLRFLLIDQTLTDFHLIPAGPADASHQIPATFAPALAGPYRVWAEAVPVETALPEYPSADVGGAFRVVDRSRRDFLEALEASVEGLRFALTFPTGGAPPARQVSLMRIAVTDPSGQPVTRLEPFMQAFAHLTGFYDDGATVLRLHPVGGDILRDDLRGGPWLTFRIYPPKTGFIRFFCQVRVDGRVVTAPLGFFISR